MSKSTLFAKIIEGIFENSDAIQIRISVAASRFISSDDDVKNWINKNYDIILFGFFTLIIYGTIYIIYRICKNNPKMQIFFVSFFIFVIGFLFYELAIIMFSFFTYFIINKIRIINNKLDIIAKQSGIEISARDLDAHRGK